jgi:hypothetical protein
MKTRYRFLLTSLSILLSLFSLIFSIQSSKSEKSNKPTSARVDLLKGYISTRLSDTNQSTQIHPQQELATQNILEVPGSNHEFENWVHLQFKVGSSRLNPLVQVGPAPDDSEYSFPCYHSGSGLWGVSKITNNICDRIVINKSNQQAKKSQQGKGSKDIFIAQANGDQFTIVPRANWTLIYVHQEAGKTLVDVLTGSVKISTTTVRAGIRYADAGDGRRGNTTVIPKEVYNSKPVQIFLDSNNWSEDIRFDIKKFQETVEQQLQKPVPIEPFPEPTNIPESPTPQPTQQPTIKPTIQPTIRPTIRSTIRPTPQPTIR